MDECGLCGGPGFIDWYIDADGDNLGAEAHFNNVMINKVGNALERKREELAKTFVRDAQVVKDEED